MDTSLNSLFPEVKTVVIGETSFVIREFVAHELPAVVALASNMGSVSEETVAALVADNSERLFALVSSVTGLPIDVVHKIRLPVLLALVEEIIDANLDFFVQVLPKALSRVGSKVTGSMRSSS
jgi:hypothetical protein